MKNQMKFLMNRYEFEEIVFHILCYWMNKREIPRYELEIDWETFWINNCIEKFEELNTDEWWQRPDWYHYLYQTLKQKNADYSPFDDAFANFRMCETLWVSVEDGIKVRLCDKVSRVRNLQTKEPSVVWESLADTYLDIAWYLLLLYIWKYWDDFYAQTFSYDDEWWVQKNIW